MRSPIPLPVSLSFFAVFVVTENHDPDMQVEEEQEEEEEEEKKKNNKKKKERGTTGTRRADR